MSTSAVENYLKAIYALTRSRQPASTSSLAGRLGVSAPAVSAMLKRLAEQGLVEHMPYAGAQLTHDGRLQALRVVRRHRVLELYLADRLGFGWDQVHEEAEQLEHAASDRLIDAMAAALGEPEFDPHGAPIPSGEQGYQEPVYPMLAELEVGCAAHLRQIADEDPALLRYLAERGLVPGAAVAVLAREPFGGPVRLRVGDAEQSIGRELSHALLVQPIRTDPTK